MSKVGDLRLVKSGTTVWSICNQDNIVTTKDTVVEICNTCYGNDAVFVKPKEVIGMTGIPGLIGKGKDEWSLSYKNTEPYELPPPQIFTAVYTG